MDKPTAQRLVRDTFKAPFDRARYRRFVNEICNGFDDAKAQNMLVPEAFAAHVKSCQRLGTFTSPDDELADVLVVYLTESWKLERTRTALRDFVAHKLKRGEGSDNAYKEAGLIAFVAPDSQSWRFSYVRMDYETKRDPKTGKIKAEERLTPARRYSYLVGADEECHTAQTRFLALLQDTAAKPTLAQIEEAFSVESVTKEFFNEYARLFKATDEALTAVVASQPAICAEFQAKSVSTAAFAKKLLGQIVFLYFIQKKGWLGVSQGQPWGSGPRHFLRQLADRAVANGQCLFHEVLEPLFYDTLATDRGPDAWCPTFQCRIPFLNGGLFEPLAGYDWEKRAIQLPNALFTNSQRLPSGDIGAGILDVFDRYNFTINEAEPLEKEVAIDPEMLGKVFENLIEENRRKGLGAFYTPREIVHYMCQESLIHYLDATINPRDRVIGRTDIEALIREGEQAAHYETARKDGTVSYRRRLPEAVEKNAHALDEALKSMMVCDPAIGSGAFPVGMMTEIVRARAALTPYFDDMAERTAYHFKRHAIQNSLYGVDIDIGAVEIAKLRLWLSLVVDEEDVQQIKPLPNLDYKVVVGNSLLGVEKNLFNDEYFKQLEELKPKFFNESDRAKKAQFKQRIEELIHKLTKGREVFDFEIYFSEVFHAKGGFDVVIGNPPYVRQEEIKDLKPLLKPRYECFTGTADLFIYFYERGIKLLHDGGQFAFITSNKWYRSGYGEKLRDWLARNTQIHELIDFGDAPVFEAIAYPTIVLLERIKKSKANPDSTFRALTWQPGPPLADFVSVVRQQSFEIPQRSLDKSGWRLEGVAKRNLLKKLRAAGTPLGDYCKGRFYYGIKTGLNDAFVVDRAIRDRLITEHSSSAGVLKPFLRGRDVKRWRVDFADQYLIKIESSENKRHPWSDKPAKDAENLYAITYPAIHAFHQQFRGGLIKRSDQGRYFWELRSCAYWQEFEQPKIIAPAITDKVNYALDKNAYYSNDKTSILIPPSLAYTLAILNSSLSGWITQREFASKQGGFFEFKPMYVSQIPIPVATPAEQAELEALVQDILENPNAANIADREAEINDRVYRLYSLTREEIALVEED
jgi:hypothetical protein